MTLEMESDKYFEYFDSHKISLVVENFVSKNFHYSTNSFGAGESKLLHENFAENGVKIRSKKKI